MILVFIRSLLFNFFFLVSTVVFCIPVALSAPLGQKPGFRITRFWVRLNFWLLKHLVRLDYRVEGRENIPSDCAIVYWKHQSAWETLAMIITFPMQAWVLKRELMWVPLLSQALMTFEPIAIDRKSGHAAVNQVIKVGTRRLLEEHLWVMIFPEGTRMPPGTTRRYGISGALLADAAGKPIVPVAHNAGDFWRRNAFLKYPGTIQVRIGKPVYVNKRPPLEVNTEIQHWMEAQMKEISPGYAGIVLERKPRR